MTGNQGRWPKIDQDGGIADVTLLILEWLGEQGVNAVIRVDADNAPTWTFAASGGPLEHGMRAGWPSGSRAGSPSPRVWPGKARVMSRVIDQ